MADTKPKMTLKLFIHKENHKVIFAEARKEFIDFLFNLLTLPLGTVTQIVTKNQMVGGIGNIYKSVEGLKEGYFVSNNQTKDTLIKPITPDATVQMIHPLTVPAQGVKKFYWCGRQTHPDCVCIAEDPRASCKAVVNTYNTCGQLVPKQVRIASYEPKCGEGGYVKDEVAYLVADDLSVEPLSTTSIVNFLSSNGIKHMGLLAEKVVHLDMNKGLKLLKASLESKAVLTSVFLSDSKA